jgi:hypothetical protein
VRNSTRATATTYVVAAQKAVCKTQYIPSATTFLRDAPTDCVQNRRLSSHLNRLAFDLHVITDEIVQGKKPIFGEQPQTKSA